ncbi:MAG: hypothetical protein ACUVRO_09880 [Armatimonadota bacterium]
MKAPTILALPTDPRTLLKIIEGFGVHGETQFPVYRAAWLCPAGVLTVVNLTQLMPPGYVAMMAYPMRAESTYYSPNISAVCVVDNTRVVTPVPAVLTGPTEISLGEWYVVRDNVKFYVTNAATRDAVITSEVQAALIQKSFYEEWFRPALERSWKLLNQVVEEEGGRKR